MINKNEKTTILLTSIILSMILVFGAISPAFAGVVDVDMDGFSPPADCDDNDDTVFPNAAEVVGDGIDQNCDGIDTFAHSGGDLNAAAIQIKPAVKAPSDPATNVLVEVFADNTSMFGDPNTAVLYQATVTVNNIPICPLDFTDEVANNDSDPNDGGLTILGGEAIQIDGGTCMFNTDPGGATPAVNMAWTARTFIVGPTSFIIKDGFNSPGNAAIQGTTLEQAFVLSLVKLPDEGAKSRINPETGLASATFTYQATYDSAKVPIPTDSDLVNCRIFDDTFGVFVDNGAFTLAAGQSSELFEKTFDINTKVTNEATLTCIDQFTNTQTAIDTGMHDVFSPDVDITKAIKAKVALGEAPEYNIKVTNTGDADLFGCVITDAQLNLNVPVEDGNMDPIVLSPGDTFPTDGSFLMVTGPILQSLDKFTNTARVDCDDQKGDGVDDEATVMVTPVNFKVNILKECDAKEVVLDVSNPPTIDCTVKIWKDAGSTELTDCKFTDVAAGIPEEAHANITNEDPAVVDRVYSYPIDLAEVKETGKMTNTAKIDCATQELERDEDESTSMTDVLFPSIDVTKICTEQEGELGPEIEWMWTITNTSLDMATALVVTSSGTFTNPDNTTIDPYPEDASGPQEVPAMGELTHTWTTTGSPGTYTNFIRAIGIYQDNQRVVDEHTVSCDIPEVGEDGCTPGFWKANADKNDAVAWPVGMFMSTDIDPEASFIDMFMITEDVNLNLAKGKASTDRGDSDDPTMFGALGARGGGENAAARHCTAALLNALDVNEVNYGVSAETVKAECSDAFNTVGDDRADELSKVHQKYAELNERGCSQNQQGEPIEPEEEPIID